MSVNLIHCVWQHYPEGSTALRLMLAIAEASSEQGNCYVPVGVLAMAGRMSRVQAHRALKRLRSERWVVTSRVLGQGRQQVIQLNIPKLRRCERPGYEPYTEPDQTPGMMATEAGLLERVELPQTMCQGDTANSQSAASTSAAPSVPLWRVPGRHRRPFAHGLHPHRSAITERSLSDAGGSDRA